MVGGSDSILIDYFFHIESAFDLLFLGAVPVSGGNNKNGKDERGGHQARNEIESLGVVSIDLPQVSEEQRSKDGGERPGQHHQTENGANVPRPEIVSRECRSNAIRAPVAHHEDECDDSQNRQ
jgi:hypothetical protein